MKRVLIPGMLVLLLTVSGCDAFSGGFVVEDGSILNNGIAVVNGSVAVGSDAEVKGGIDSVNGSISVGTNSRVGAIENVNGSVKLAEGVAVDGGVENVNGSITAAGGVSVAGNVETVNGRIKLGTDSRVTGKVATVNGAIELLKVSVGAVESHNGSITLDRGTHVSGPLHIKPTRGLNLGVSSPPKVIIGAGCRVDGPLTFEREVELYVHETATVGEISGAEPIAFSGDRP